MVDGPLGGAARVGGHAGRQCISFVWPFAFAVAKRLEFLRSDSVRGFRGFQRRVIVITGGSAAIEGRAVIWIEAGAELQPTR